MIAVLLRMALAVAVVSVSSAAAVRAGSITVIGNYPQTNDGTLSAVTSLDGSYGKAVGFTMGGQSYVLDSVTLRLAEQPGSISTLTLGLFGGTSSGPSGTVLAGFDTPDIPSLASNVAFTPLSGLVLQAGTTYWLEVSGQSDTLNGIVWYASNPGVNPAGVATSLGALFTSHFGTPGSLEPSSQLNTFQVTGSLPPPGPLDIPEPAGLIQGASSLLVGLLLASRRLLRIGAG
jgi:hypothetical protein